MKKISKYLAVFAASTFILNILVPGALAYTSTEISGNGSSSENFTTITKIEEKKVVQNNTAAVNNVVNATSSSGNNIVDGNTGGEVSLSTGDATTNVNLKTLANANLALFGNCDDCEGKKVEIVGNGAHSLNVVEGNFVIETSVCQDNFSSIDNQVNANAITGNNQISDNTGGDIKLNSGSATVNTNVVNEANLNWAQVGYTGGDNDWLSAKISNNGADTQNFINVLDNRLALVAQENFAWIDNRINANATTGQNHVLANTESYVWLNTGSATANVNVDNTTNFNLAEV